MSRVVMLSAEKNMIDEIAPLLVSNGHDFSGNVVVFPGKRPGHALRKAIAARSGSSVLPPQIFSMDTFVDHCFSVNLGQHKILIEPVDAIALLHEIHLKQPQRLGGEHFESLDAFLPLGLKLYNELEEVWMAGLPLRSVRESLAGFSYGELTSLSIFYEQFYETAGQRGLVTRSMKYRTVAEQISTIDIAGYSMFILAGFYSFTNSEKAIVRHLDTFDNVVQLYHHGPRIGSKLKELGLSVEIPAAQPRRPEVHFYRSADTHGQVFGLSQRIDELVKTNSSAIDNSVIVMPAADTLFAVYHQSLSLLPEEKYNISLGYPVTRTPVYGFLGTVLDLIVSKYESRYSAFQYTKFVLHPYTKNIRFGQRSDVTRILFNTIEELFLREHSAAFFSLDELENHPDLFDLAAKRAAGTGDDISGESLRAHLRSIHDKTIRAYNHVTDIGGFASISVEVLRYINAHSTAQLHPFFRRFAEALIESLESVSRSLLHDKRFGEFAGYVTFLRTYIADTKVPFTGTPLRGLQVLGFLETHSLRFDNVFVLDANDDLLPGDKGHDVLLPRKFREALGLPTYRDREQETEYYFELLLQGAKQAHIFFVEDGKREKSRFVEKLLWEKQERDKQTEPDRYVATLRYRIQLANSAPTPIPNTTEIVNLLKGFSFNATALDMYLRCQLQFYYHYILRLRERDEVTGGVELMEVGSFLHRVLAEFFGELKGALLTRERLNIKKLDTILDARFNEEYGPDPMGAQYLLKNQIKTHLTEFIEQYQVPLLPQKITILDVESSLQATIAGFSFTGKLDRVEERDGSVHILDYKTGSSDKRTRIKFKDLALDVRESWSSAIGSLQLPLYAILYASAKSFSREKISPAYLFLGRQEIDEEIEHPLFENGENVAQKLAELEGIIRGLLSEMTDVDHSFEPTKDLESNCPGCAFKVICGTQWVS